MAQWTALGRTATLALLLGSTSALADVTAADVWADWKGLMESYGMSLTVTSEAQSGGVLTVQGMTMGMDLPDGEMSGTIDEVVFTERGDGTVGITMSPAYTMTLDARSSDGEAVQMTVTVTQDGMEMLASGDADRKTYTYEANALEVAVADVTVDGAPAQGDFRTTLTGVEGTYALATDAEGRDLESALNAESLTFLIDVLDPQTSGKLTANVEMSGINSVASARLPATLDMEDIDAMLKAGLSSASSLAYGATEFSFAFDDAGQSAAGTGKLDSGSFEVALDPEAITYASSSKGVNVAITGSEIPLPEVALALEEGAFRLSMPIARTDAPADFGLLTSYRGLSVSNGIWNLFDPGEVLPRDPANLVIDLAGQARWLIDIMNPEAAASMNAAPGEVNALTLNELELSIAGASLTGSGGFTFDNTDLTTFDGMPRPKGEINLQLDGGNGLLDKLVQLGFVPQDQAMGFRMMLGIFAQVGSGPDSLVSKIEVNEAGELLANGQRLR